MPGNYEKRPSILSENSLSKQSSLNELSLAELGEDQKSQQTNNSALIATTSVPDCQHRNSTDLAMQNYLVSVNYPLEHLKRYYKVGHPGCFGFYRFLASLRNSIQSNEKMAIGYLQVSSDCVASLGSKNGFYFQKSNF